MQDYLLIFTQIFELIKIILEVIRLAEKDKADDIKKDQ